MFFDGIGYTLLVSIRIETMYFHAATFSK